MCAHACGISFPIAAMRMDMLLSAICNIGLSSETCYVPKLEPTWTWMHHVALRFTGGGGGGGGGGGVVIKFVGSSWNLSACHILNVCLKFYS